MSDTAVETKILKRAALLFVLLSGLVLAGFLLYQYLNISGKTALQKGPDVVTKAEQDGGSARNNVLTGLGLDADRNRATQNRPLTPSLDGNPSIAPDPAYEAPDTTYIAQQQAKLEDIRAEIGRKKALKIAALTSPLGGTTGGSRTTNDPTGDTSAPNPTFEDPAPMDPETPAPDLSEYTLAQNTHRLDRGSLIPAILQTKIDSSLPGLIKAQTRADIYDSLTGNTLLIPSGSKILGSYGEATERGQKRLYVYWTSMITPDGTVIELDKLSATDEFGAGGLSGRRSDPFLRSLITAFGLSVATATLDQDTGDKVADAINQAASGSVATVTERYVESALSQGPRFRVKAGTSFNIILDTDLWL